jgi:hypothetical protein
MRASVVICNGVIRSGSTWSFNVCREMVQEDAIRNRKAFGSAYLDAQPLEQFISQPQPPAASAVVKAHGLGPVAMTALRHGRARAVCTYRDPRDCIASDLAFMRYPLEIAIKRVGGTLDPIRVYQTTPNILLVRYEDMMTDRFREIRRIADHLGIEMNAEDVRRIDANTNMDSSERVCKQMKHQPQKMLKIATHLVDPTTHLHENHLNGGTVGRWRQDLSTDQAAYLSEMFSGWLLQLGYETPESLRAILATSAGRRQMTLPQQMFAQQQPRYGSFTVGAAGSARFANS